MVMTDMGPLIVIQARTTAVPMTKRPDESNSATPSLRTGRTRRCQRMGSGIDRIAASVTTLSTTRLQKFCGRYAHSGPGRGLICQLADSLRACVNQ